jgi:hypothetical protein
MLSVFTFHRCAFHFPSLWGRVVMRSRKMEPGKFHVARHNLVRSFALWALALESVRLRLYKIVYLIEMRMVVEIYPQETCNVFSMLCDILHLHCGPPMLLFRVCKAGDPLETVVVFTATVSASCLGRWRAQRVNPHRTAGHPHSAFYSVQSGQFIYARGRGVHCA